MDNNLTSQQLTFEFESIRGQLRSYLLRITACVEDADDIIQDTYLKAIDKLNTVRGELNLKDLVVQHCR